MFSLQGLILIAEVAELVDALGSGSSGGSPVGVRVPPSAPINKRAAVKPAFSAFRDILERVGILPKDFS